MKNCLFLILFGCLFFSASGQTIKELEKELSYFIGGETYKDKVSIARKLLHKDPFNITAIRFINHYYRENKIDSISLFFNDLLKKHPNKAQAFLLGVELIPSYNWLNNKEYSKKRIRYLDSALKYENNNIDALYHLAKTYYIDFIRPLYLERNSIFGTGDPVKDSLFFEERRKERKSFFEHSADSALKYFYRSWKLDNERRDLIYFPTKQLECFLNIPDTNFITFDSISGSEKYYFPSWYFIKLDKNWQCDYTYIYLNEAEFSKSISEELTVQLKNLKEPCLYCKNITDENEIYRFTWLRSFDQAICIRIEKIRDKYYLFWKVGRGAAGYDTKGIKRKGNKRIKEKHWSFFTELVGKTNFDNLPNEEYILMTDGAGWPLERKTSKGFKAHDTNEPNERFKEACLYLLKLSNIRIKKENIY